MRREGLQRIAQLSGGACLEPKELAKLGGLLNAEPITTTVRSERPMWDTGWVAALLVGLLGMEWILRRRHDLT
jgi:hypothetical protein